MNGNLLSGPGGVGRLDFLAIDCDVPFLNQPLNGSPRDCLKNGTQIDVDPLAWTGLLDGNRFGAAAHLRTQSAHSAFCIPDSALIYPLAGPGLTERAPSFCQDEINKSPTPIQMALSATLNAGKPASSGWP